MLTFEEQAAAISATRSDFGNLFLQAQVGRSVDERVSFDAIASSPDDRQAFAEALQYAHQNEWHDALVDVIIAAGFDDGHLAEDISAGAGDDPLHAMVNSFAGFLQPHVVLKGLNSGMRRTGKILINDQPKGTGVLIANDLLLTAWHVVSSLFNAVPGGGYQQKPGAGEGLKVVFDEFLKRFSRGQSLQVGRSRTVKAHADWCVAYCECHADELQQRLPANPAALDGLWDYAVIRLAEPIGFERGWATPNPKVVVPRAQDKVILLQHPNGQPMRLDFDEVAAPAAAQEAAVPKFRFLHYVNALPGSSGGPCFDRSFEFFGFHQGEWKAGAGRVTNRGVPLVRVLEHIERKYGGLRPNGSASLIWRLAADNDPEKDNAPVIGCDEFQQQVIHSAVLGKPKFFAIVGREEGMGKTMRVDVLSSMLPDADHLKIRLAAEAISGMDALELVKTICSNAGAPAPHIDPPAETHSTVSIWLKEEVVPKIIGALSSVRGSRLVWFAITDLDKANIKGQNASELLWLLYDQVRTLDWFRVVLDGLMADIPGAFRDVQYRERVGEVTLEDIETYLKRFAAQVEVDLDAGARLVAMGLHGTYDTDLINNRPNAARNLSKEARRTAENILRIASGG